MFENSWKSVLFISSNSIRRKSEKQSIWKECRAIWMSGPWFSHDFKSVIKPDITGNDITLDLSMMPVVDKIESEIKRCKECIIRLEIKLAQLA